MDVIDSQHSDTTRRPLPQPSEALFEGVLDTIPQIIFATDRHGTPIYANRTWYSRTGREGLEADVIYLLNPLDAERFAVAWENALAGEVAIKGEYRLSLQPNESRWHWLSIQPRRDGDGRVVRWTGTALDIDEVVRTRENLVRAREYAEQSSRMKSQFLASMSHEIRTPLGAILGFADLLAEEELTEYDRVEFARIMNRNGESLRRIVDDILDISKAEAGLLSLSLKSFNPIELLSDTVSLFRKSAAGRPVSIRLLVGADTPQTCWSDPSRICQIVSNLISNALKFTEKGEIRVKVNRAERDSNVLNVEFEDTGVGIKSDHVEKLFKPFNQAHSEVQNQFGGTGLGLYLSRTIAEILGGHLELISSEPGFGSRFLLSLPLGKGPETASGTRL